MPMRMSMGRLCMRIMIVLMLMLMLLIMLGMRAPLMLLFIHAVYPRFLS